MSGNKKPSGELRGGFGFHRPWPMFWTYPSMRSLTPGIGWAIIAI